MRKYFFCKKFVLFICFVLIAPIFLYACGQVNFKTHEHTYISEYRKNLFVNKTGILLATFTSGEREKDYDLTGIKTPLVDFGVLTIKFNVNIGDTLPTFELKVDDKTFLGTMEKNPYDGSFVYDIETQVKDESEITLKLPDFEQNLKLICVSSGWNTTWEDSVEIFCQKYNKEIASHTKQGKFLGEIYVKIVSTDKTLDNVFWYVLCVCQDGNIYACLINPNTREIIQS